MPSLTHLATVALVSSTLFCVPATTSAGLITSFSVEIAPIAGQLEYIYLLSNLQTSTLSVIDLSIDVDVAAGLASITSPIGWVASYNDGDSFISWQSSDVLFDLQPGGTDVFTFRSDLPPSKQGFSILGIDENSPDFDFNDGLIDTPTSVASSVPEPLSILHLFAACLAGGVVSARTRVNSWLLS